MDRIRRGDTHAEAPPAHAHLVGIADRGMLGLAQGLVQRGIRVTGSPRALGPIGDPLRGLGVRFHAGHPRCPRDAEVLVYGPSVGRGDTERLSAARRGVPQHSPTDWLEAWMRRKIGLAAVGRRLAAAASGMTGWILSRAGLDPTVVLGASSPQIGGWARLGTGPHFVVEAMDEGGRIGPASPLVALLLDLETPSDRDYAGRCATIRRFAASIPDDGLVLRLQGHSLLSEATRGLESAVEGVGLEPGSAWWGGDLRADRGCYRFRAFHHGRFALEARLQVPGRRNVLAALAAIAACDRLELPAPAIRSGLEEFTGLSRDFESRGSYRGVTLLDDEAGDPVAIAEALATAREAHGRRRLWAVVQAGGAGMVLGEDGPLAEALVTSDRILLVGVAAAGEGRPGGRGALVAALEARGKWVGRAADLGEAISDLDRDLEPGDVLVTLGAGEVGTIADAFIRRLSRDRQGR